MIKKCSSKLFNNFEIIFAGELTRGCKCGTYPDIGDDHINPGNMFVYIIFKALCLYENIYDFQFENMILNETFILFKVHKTSLSEVIT